MLLNGSFRLKMSHFFSEKTYINFISGAELKWLTVYQRRSPDCMIVLCFFFIYDIVRFFMALPDCHLRLFYLITLTRLSNFTAVFRVVNNWQYSIFRKNKCDNFHYFCSIHILWILVRCSNDYPRSMFYSKIVK